MEVVPEKKIEPKTLEDERFENDYFVVLKDKTMFTAEEIIYPTYKQISKVLGEVTKEYNKPVDRILEDDFFILQKYTNFKNITIEIKGKERKFTDGWVRHEDIGLVFINYEQDEKEVKK
jgi:hypothetical protein